MTAFNEILLIGAAVALVGGILGLVLVRQRDFVKPGSEQRASRRARGSLSRGPWRLQAPNPSLRVASKRACCESSGSRTCC